MGESMRTGISVMVGALALTMFSGCIGEDDAGPVDLASSTPAGSIDASETVPSGTSDGGDATEPVREVTPAFPLQYTDCRVLILRAPVEASGVADRVPEGFEHVPFSDVEGTATAVILAASCASAESPRVQIDAPMEFWVAWEVIPPTDLAGDAEMHWLPIETIVNSPSLDEAYADLGLDSAGQRDQDQRTTTALAGGESGEATALAAAGGNLHLRTAVPATQANDDAFTLRTYIVEEGVAVAALDYSIESTTRLLAGAGTFNVDQGGNPFGSTAQAGIAAHLYFAADRQGWEINPVSFT